MCEGYFEVVTLFLLKPYAVARNCSAWIGLDNTIRNFNVGPNDFAQVKLHDFFRIMLEPFGLAIARGKSRNFIGFNTPTSHDFFIWCAKRTISVAKKLPWNQKDRSDNQDYEQIILPGSAFVRPDENISDFAEQLFHSSITFQTRRDQWLTICPSRINILRLAMSAASGLCVIITIVCPIS